MPESLSTLAVRPWAFWAPSREEAIEPALELAGVLAGTRFLDLGCGDGRVLVAAAKRGAEVRGIEIDPSLADTARHKLAEAGVRGQVEIEDMFTTSMEADVIYAYLTPVTLSRLRGPLSRARPGTRLVTPGYGVAGWHPLAFEAGNYLYELPGRPAAASTEQGWGPRAVLAILPADRRVLIPLTFNATGGPLALQLDPALARAANYSAGEESSAAPGPVPVDLIFEHHGAGSVIAGAICAQGAELTLAVVFARNERGQWAFGPEEGAEFRQKLDEAIGLARAD